MLRLIYLLLFSLSLPVNAMSVEEELAQVKYFSLGYNGFVASKSEGELLYEKILSAINPEEVFLRIIWSERATNESKLYAACGLWTINKKIPGEFTPAKGYVTVLQGDILRKEDFEEYFFRIKERGCT
ncbi:hypothetical protein COO59_16925 [Mixta theicola]|uniref:Uncharacterized protein n=1 Tax=Mixta theicola TaxID=1458355 RepID=A0A2K1Q5Y4_9GAMM|nr:MchS3 family protein [Mixta theicola]PNS10445.1 hypothetical protein COO59_16925 [Mixta theicola]GLR08307.1 hypothetical protein GCM10007905_10260 [Mixta theicola]